MNARRVGLALAAIHLLLFAAFLVWKKAISNEDGQAELLWIIWIPIDFPWSLLVPLLSQLSSDQVISPALGGVSRLLFYLPHFIHGVVGTIWWYYIPRMLTALLSLRNRK